MRIIIKHAWLNLADLLIAQADIMLEAVTLMVNRKIRALQAWLFLQNQKLHGVDVRRFCGGGRK